MLNFNTNNPTGLLAAYKKAIVDGHVDTWVCDPDGDFTHTPDQWNKKAWLRPVIKQGQLCFKLIAPQGKGVTWAVYGVYHGRFIESMITHCNQLFTTALATAKPTDADNVAA